MSSSSQHNFLTEQQETSTNIKRSDQPPITAVMTQNKGSLDLILIPGHEEECRRVWETQVLLPTSLNNKIVCFASPYRP